MSWKLSGAKGLGSGVLSILFNIRRVDFFIFGRTCSPKVSSADSFVVSIESTCKHAEIGQAVSQWLGVGIPGIYCSFTQSFLFKPLLSSCLDTELNESFENSNLSTD